MPRLLLVDDNPSIHKIAETLLGSSPIELTCVGSAGEAMMLLDSGERFDIALLDTAMPGMDGWELLSRMRKHPESAFIPIAMMAGVLDTVDPEKLKHAPIQGFIKKPIELRELAERVQQLLATPVTLAEAEGNEGEPTVLSPFATVPGTKIKSLPEFRDVAAGPAPDEPRNESEADDLLLLTPEDFWFEETPSEVGSEDFLMAQATAQAMAEAQDQPPLALGGPADAALDLEELDLEALKDLPNEMPPSETPTEPEVPEFSTSPSPVESLTEAAEAPVMTSEDLGQPVEAPYEEETLAIPGLALRAQALSAQEPYLTDMPVHEFLTEDMPAHEFSDLEEPSPLAAFAPEIPSAELPAPVEFESSTPQAEIQEESAFPSATTMPAVERPAPALGAEAPRDPAALVQALMSDPVLMEALTRAVVARLGDQALREIAWEVMPELAEKLPR
ncbi:MAG: response regulator [Acidobacteriota bacterium]|nr:response regulator [Acidobacteriota bacterium]